MATRRKFLSILGVGSVSAPLAAKEAIDKSIADLVIRGEEASPVAPAVRTGMSRWREHQAEQNKTIPQALAWLRANNGHMPEHIERQYREDATYVHALDPDIASKRSWSMNVKINEQRQRNYHRNVQRYLGQTDHQKAKDAFEKAVGFKWPW